MNKIFNHAATPDLSFEDQESSPAISILPLEVDLSIGGVTPDLSFEDQDSDTAMDVSHNKSYFLDKYRETAVININNFKKCNISNDSNEILSSQTISQRIRSLRCRAREHTSIHRPQQ